MSDSTKSVIRIENAIKSFGSQAVIRGVSFNLEPGHFYALLGKNGAGKSTLMRLLMRYDSLDQGEGWIGGRSFESDADDLNLEVGYVSEMIDYGVAEPIGRFTRIFARLYPKWDQKKFDDVLSRLRLNPQRLFRELSRGQKMQVVFAVAIAIQPRILILDEITSVLDADARAYCLKFLGDFVQGGGTVLMATNLVSEVQHYADHLLLLEDGKLELNCPLKEAAARFVKLRRPKDFSHGIFELSSCAQVGLNSDGSTSHLVESAQIAGHGIPDEIRDRRGVTAEELFIYFTRESGEGLS